MTQAAGVSKQLARKAESTYGVAPGASSAQALRRVTSTLDLTKEKYTSAEIRTSQQNAKSRHGVRRVAGTIQGEMSPGTYAAEFAQALRRAFSAVSAITSLSITISGSGPTYTVARAAGSWLTDGIKIGQVVRLTAGSFAAPNLNKNLVVSAVTALNLTVYVLNASALTAEGPIASATLTVPGKVTYAPASGHTDTSLAYEHWFSDISQSELFLGCQVTQMQMELPPTGLATVSIQLVGKNATFDTAQYFTSPTAETTTENLAAVNGLLLVGGVADDVVTGLSITLSSARSGDPVVGANTVPRMFQGRITCTGQLTAYFEDGTYRDIFDDETETTITCVLSASNDAAADFISITLPRVKFDSSQKNDGEGGIVQTVPFEALQDETGGAGADTEATTFYIHDSDAA